MKRLFLATAIVATLVAHAQQPGPALTVDASVSRHAISPDVYGINFYWDLGTNTDPQRAAYLAAAQDVRATVRRNGGNGTSTYHWQFDVNNIAADWFYEVLPDPSVNASRLPDGSSFNTFADQARTTGGKIMGTVPILGWLPKARAEMCSFDIRKYGNQCRVDPYAQYHTAKCGDGVVFSSTCGTNPTYIQNDPNDAYAQYDESFQTQWIQYLLSRYGKANQGGVTIWSLDNEPIWWDSTHRDIHPAPYTYDELLSLNVQYAQAIKQADPTALVSGPVGDNWASLFFSKRDIQAGWNRGDYWSNPIDRNAHGGVPLMAWYLQQMRAYEQQHGLRLLDYLDQHAYIHPGSIQTGPDSTHTPVPESAAVKALRLESTRLFWDPTYVVTNDYWIRDVEHNGAPIAPRFIPRLREIIDANYPGTKLALTEYGFWALDTINGALAQADLLGIFGREGVDVATLWGPPKPTDPGAFAFKIYRNYDGIGGAFGEIGVQAASADQGQLSIYAALRSDSMLTVMVINKATTDLSTTLSLSNFNPGASARVWRYSAAKLDAVVAQPDLAVAGGTLAATFPAYSMTLLVIPPASFAVSKPVVQALQSAASFDTTTFAPGQMAVVWGMNLGPRDLVRLQDLPLSQQLDSNGLVRDNMAGVRILFDGIPGRMVYVRQDTCAVVIPYFGAAKTTTHVQVEYQGVRSDPLEIPISPTAPGLFTANMQGSGRGAIQVDANGTANSTDHPAHPDSTVVLWLTGEGVTDPPGVDGRLAGDVLPKPVAAVSVEIGGLAANIEYAGAAPTMMPGLMQINARVGRNVAPGDAVPVRVRIGNNWSRSNVTLVVR